MTPTAVPVFRILQSLQKMHESHFFLGGADYFIRDQRGREYKLNLGSKTKNWYAFHNLKVGDERIVRASSAEITGIEGFQYDPCLTGVTIIIVDDREDFHCATDGVQYYYPGDLSPGEYRVNVDPEGVWGGNRWPEITIPPPVCQLCCVERCCPCP